MNLILPAISSPELKAFPLHLRHYRYSGFAPSLPNLPRACRVGRFASNGETVSSTSFQPQTRLTLASALSPFVVLSDCCARGGKTLISRISIYPSATCRGLRPCLLWHLWPVFASAYADAKTVPKHHRPTHFRPLVRHCFLNRISRPKGRILIISIAKGCILRLSSPDAFIV